MNRRRVVITGLGCATPVGVGVSKFWDSLVHGRSGVDHITIFDASSWPIRIGAEVRDLDIEAEKAKRPTMSGAARNAIFAIVAAEEAFTDSGLEVEKYDPERMGVYLGAGEGVPDFHSVACSIARSWEEERVNGANFIREMQGRLNVLRELEQEPNIPGAHLSIKFDARGVSTSCLTACAASSQAFGEALQVIRHGDADIMITGGCHSMLHPMGLTGFTLLTALSPRNDDPKRASRPFDLQRDGFILGEGGAILIIEELEHAKARRAHIYAEAIGYGSTADSFRVTDSHENGRGAIAAIRGAIKDADIDPDEVQYINAHGTSTKVNDRVETLASKEVFGERAYKLPMSSTKGTTGHLIAAAGAAEMIACVKAIENGILPPTINQEESDPECDLDYVPNEAREQKVDVAMSNSFGFGGQNISLLIRRYDGS